MLEDFDPLPRMAAVFGLAEVAGQGHRKAIELALNRLKHRQSGTRQAAVQVLEKIASKDDFEVVGKIMERLRDKDEHVRDSSKYALIELAGIDKTEQEEMWAKRKYEEGKAKDAAAAAAAAERAQTSA